MFQRTPARNLRFLRIAVGLAIAGFLVCYAMTFIGDSTRQMFLRTKYIDPHADPSLFANTPERLKAVIVILVRNNELEKLLPTLKQFEDRWNKKYNYPYVYLNDVPFTEEFIEKTSAMTKAKTYHGRRCLRLILLHYRFKSSFRLQILICFKNELTLPRWYRVSIGHI